MFVDWDPGPYTVDSTTDIKADINKTYRCVSDIRVYMKNVTIVLWDATIQAYLPSSNFSKEGKVWVMWLQVTLHSGSGPYLIWQPLYF